MSPYGVVSTGKELGVIELVRDSDTIMNIQQKNGIRAAVQMDSLGLFNWIMMHNKDRYVCLTVNLLCHTQKIEILIVIIFIIFMYCISC